MVLQVLLLYIPLPMFWALCDQQVRTDKQLGSAFRRIGFETSCGRCSGSGSTNSCCSGLCLQGSRWTIQAARMNMALVSLICKAPMTCLGLVIAGRILGFK